MNDINSQRGKSLSELELRNHLLTSIIEFSQDAILLIDVNGKIAEFNLSFTKLFNIIPSSDVKELNIYSFLFEPDVEKMESDIKYVFNNENLANCEYRINTDNPGIHTYIEVSYNLIQLSDLDQKYITLFIRDITKRMIDENALQKAKAKAEQADRLKTAFLANMSHEIRTPINAILGFADLLKDDDLEEGEQEEFINIINTNGKNLLNLINDIIDIAKIEANQLKIIEQEVSLEELFVEIKESMLDIMKHLEKEHIELSYTLPKELTHKNIHTDYYRLRQVLVNLIGNACKFTDEGKIHYSVRVVKNKLEFQVNDSGVGIKPEDIDMIFDRFRQSDLVNVEGGTGLGLTISQNILKLMKGKIWVESDLGEGSRFSFQIPHKIIVGNDIIEYSTTELEKSNLLENKIILIVEDTETNYHLLDIILKRENAKTIWATDGVQAVEICKRNSEIDLILMDINLPIMDGYEATRLIKEDKPDLPIIAQTAYAMAGEKAKSKSFGCDAYVAKPINPQYLLSVIKEIFADI